MTPEISSKRAAAIQESAILDVQGLKKHFYIPAAMFQKPKAVHAVDGIDLKIKKGEVLSLVGESGCGKSTTGRCILRLLEPTSGRIKFENSDITYIAQKELRAYRRRMQIIFQDPYASLNPRMTVGSILEEPLIIHRIGNKAERMERIISILEKVGLGKESMGKYPHEFSGGQRQRIGIARALILNPVLIVADEPISALDVSIQAQIINLLEDLQEEFQLSFLFIAHDLNIVRHFSDRVAVMYLGRIVEMADANELYKRPQHPYTEALLSAILTAAVKGKKKRISLEGDIPSPIDLPRGCRFYSRCPKRMKICQDKEPEFRETDKGHFVACYLYE